MSLRKSYYGLASFAFPTLAFLFCTMVYMVATPTLRLRHSAPSPAAWYLQWKASLPTHWFPEVDRGEVSPYVDQAAPLVYCSIPKNGCTQYKGLLFRMKGDPRYLDPLHVHAWGEERGRPHNITRVKDLPDIEARRLLTDPRVPRFVVARNPVVRVLSGFMDKSPLFPCPKKVFRKWIRRKFQRPAETMCGLEMDQHWKSQLCYCGFKVAPPGQIFRVFRYEKVEEIVRYLEEVVPTPEHLRDGWGRDGNVSFLGSFSSTERDKDHTTKAEAKVAVWFDLPTFDFLVDKLSAEIDAFGYQEEMANLRLQVEAAQAQ